MRLALELLGAALYVAAHYPLVYLFGLATSLQGIRPVVYWAALVAGYAVMLALAVVRPGRLARVPPRRLFDVWLLSAPIALAMSLMFVAMKWPLEFARWGGHDVQGGEPNAALFPWLHAVLWVAIAAIWRTR
jgi:hypothetical protein